MKGILGRKLGMTQVFTEDGVLIPVTVVEATPNVVLQKKTVENDGYEAVQLGFEDVKEKRSTKPEIGHAAKANTAPKRFVEEVRDCELEVNVGDEVKVISGPFAGKQGRVESIDHEKESASVFINFLGNENLMEIGLVQLEKVEL